jgi:REP element-mobilizing transposase RayT
MDEESINIPGNFRGLDPNRELRIYRRNLPHWRQDGATYFVTFRLEDALPQSVLRELEAEKQNFKEAVERLRLEGVALRKAADSFFRNYGRLLDRHLDAGSGSCVLRDAEVSQQVIDVLSHFHGERYELNAAVVMPNHCHVLIRPFSSWPLEGVLKSWKGYSAKEINRELGRSGSLWQSDSFDRIVRDEEHYRQVVRYIRENPRKANLSPGDYRFW